MSEYEIAEPKEDNPHYHRCLTHHICDCKANKLERALNLIEWLRKQRNEVAEALSCRENETVVEAAKRWRETMEWYGSDGGCNYETICDGGQKARECLGGKK